MPGAPELPSSIALLTIQVFFLVLADVFSLACCFVCAEPRAVPGAVVFFLARRPVCSASGAVPGAVVFLV